MTSPGTNVSVRITADASGVAPGAQRASAELSRFAKSAEDAGTRAERGLGAARRGVDSISRQLGELRNLGLATIGLGSVSQAVGGYIQAADAATNLASRLRLVSDSSTAAARAQSELFRIAQSSRVSFTDLGGTYAQIATATNEMSLGQGRLLGVTQAVSQAVALSGGSAQSAQAALVQLSQGLAAGALRGEELNSVIEQTPRLAQALAQGLGVGIGELRRMGQAGELTASRVLEALEAAAPRLAREFAAMTPTVEQSFTTLKNSAGRFVSTVDEAAGGTRALATGVKSLAEGLDSLTDRAKGSSEALGPLVAAGAAAVGVAALGVALLGVKAGIAAIAVAAAPLVAILAGPVGVLLGVAAVGAGVAAAVAVVNSRAQSADSIAKGIEQRAARIEELERQTAGSMRNGHLRIGAEAELRALREAQPGAREAWAQALGREAAADPDLGASDARLRRGARDALDFKAFADAKPLDEARRGIKTRENLFREATQRMAELSKSYGNAIAEANRGGPPTTEGNRLSAELDATLKLVARDRDRQIKELTKADEGGAGARRAEAEKAARAAGLRAIAAAADERRDLERESLADLQSFAKRGLVVEEERIARERELRVAALADLQTLERRRGEIARDAARTETDPGRRDEMLAQAQDSAYRLAELEREQVVVKRQATRELEELAARQAQAVIESTARRVDAARTGVRELLAEAAARRLAVAEDIELEEAKARLVVETAEAELEALRATEGVAAAAIAVREAEVELMREQLRLQREMAIDTRVARQQKEWKTNEDRWAERQGRNSTSEFDDLTRAIEGFGRSSAKVWADYVLDGKSSFVQVREAFKRELLEMLVYKQVVQPALSAASSLFGSVFGGLGSKGFSDTAGAAISSASVVDTAGRFVPALAGGGPVQPNGLYLVGEQGPELLRTGAVGGTVIPNPLTERMLNGGGGRSIKLSQTINMGGSGARGAEVYQFGAHLQRDTLRTLAELEARGAR